MATDGIGTWAEINSAFGTNGSPYNLCPRQADLLSTGKIAIFPQDTDNNRLPKFSYLQKRLTINKLNIYKPPSGLENGLVYPAASRLSLSGDFSDVNISEDGMLLIQGRGNFTAEVLSGQTDIRIISKKIVSGKPGYYTDIQRITITPSSDSKYYYEESFNG